MIYSRNPPENLPNFADGSYQTSDSTAIIAVAIVGSILGVILLLIFFAWLFCLWQAKLRGNNGLESTARKQTGLPFMHNGQRLRHYTVRAYVGCLPKYFRGAHKVLKKETDCRLIPCWFTACCCCCQELKPDQRFLDEKLTVPSSLLQATAVRQISCAAPSSAQHGRVKMSILAPESIVVPTHRGHTDVAPSGERVESMDFYSYRVQGVADDKIMY